MRKILAAHAVIVSLLAWACAANGAPPTKLDRKIQLIDPAQGDELFKQCSRATPGKGERYFRPDAGQMQAFEKVLQPALKASRELNAENAQRAKQGYPPLSFKPNDWARDMIGLERGGQKFLYGNYYPSDRSFRKNRKGPLIICDGGANFFGAEFDLQKGEISHLAFNGAI
jgi:hypothetical protein